MSSSSKKISSLSKKMSSLSTSDPCGSSNASEWVPGIHFVTYEDGDYNQRIITTNKDKPSESNKKLRRNLKFTLCPDGDGSQIIDKVSVYKTPLNESGQWTPIDYHGYVLLQIGNLFVTMDKHTDGLTVQSSTERTDVLPKLRKALRTGVPEMIVSDQGKITVTELIDFVMENDFVNQTYNLWRGHHCKMFAKDIFDKVAATSAYYWEQSEMAVKFTLVTGFGAVAAGAIVRLARPALALAASLI